MILCPENKMRREISPSFERVFFFDTETHRFAAGCMLPKLVCLQYAYDEQAPRIVTGPEAIEVFAEALADDRVLIVGHGVAFDLGVMYANFPELADLIFAKLNRGLVSDTLTREKLIRIATGEMSTDPSAGASKQSKFNMAEVVKRRFSIDIEESKHGAESWRLRYCELEDVPLSAWPVKARDYAIDDVIYTRKMWLAQEEDPTGYGSCCEPEGLRREGWGITDESRQTQASFAFKLLEAWGNKTDPETVHELLVRTHKDVEDANDILRREGILKGAKHRDGSVTWSKNKKVIQSKVSTILGASAPLTDSGKGISTASEVLQTCLDTQDIQTKEEHPELEPVGGWGSAAGEEVLRSYRDQGLQALVDVGESQDTQSKWASTLDQGTHSSIHPNYNPLVETGRTSCFKPNLQNPKRKGGVRECFVPRKGYLFAFADYSTLELLSLSQVLLDIFGYSHMAEAIKSGKDLHLVVAAQLLNQTYDWCKANKKSKEVKDARQLAKAFNFGLPGGLGYDSFAEYAWAGYGVRLHKDEGEARKMFKNMKFNVYYGAFPEMKEYHKLIGQVCAGSGGATITQLPTGRIRGGVTYTVACNTFFQGRAADGAKRALYYTVSECYTGYSPLWTEEEHGEVMSDLYGSRPVFFLHDEIGLEVPERNAEVAARRLEKVMVGAMAEVIPEIPAQAEPVLGRRWYKGQEPVFVDGHLVPSKPVERGDGGVDWVADL